MNSVYNYEYNKEIKDKLKAMINDKASSSETVLVPAYSYLAEVLREVNKSYDGKINIHAYSTKHNHTRQGKNQIKKPNEKKNVVIEYLIVIKRK